MEKQQLTDFILVNLQQLKQGVITQTPEVIKQLLTYEILNSIGWIVVFIAITALFFVLYKRSLKKFEAQKAKEIAAGRQELSYLGETLKGYKENFFVFTIILSALSGIVIIVQICILVCIKIAPIAYLIHSFKH